MSDQEISTERRASARDQRAPQRVRWDLLALAPVAMAVYVVLPPAPAEAWFQLVAWSSVAWFVRGLLRQRSDGPTRSAGWWSVLGGFVCFAIGDLLFGLDELVFHVDAFPSTADVFYLAGYPLISIGLAALVRADPVDRGRTALIDAGIVVVPITVVGWLWFVEPVATSEGLTSLERVVSTAYPVGDLLCIALVVRLLAGGRRRRAGDRQALVLLVASLTSLLLGDAVFLGITLHGDYVSGGWSDSIYLLSYVLLAAISGHRLVITTDRRVTEDEVALSRTRLGLLASAALATPVVLAVQWWRDEAITVPLVVTGTIVSFLLVVARMGGLVEALDQSRSQLRFEARHDLLTGLPNRQQLSFHLDEALAAGEHGALLFVDLDRFKAINDTLGHAAGDDVLVEVASIMRNTVRPSDVVARLSGDEFVILIRRCRRDAAEAIAGRVVQHLQVRRRSADTVLAVTASVGMVCWEAGTPVEAAHRLMRAADHAMYEAKHASGNQLVVAAAA